MRFLANRFDARTYPLSQLVSVFGAIEALHYASKTANTSDRAEIYPLIRTAGLIRPCAMYFVKFPQYEIHGLYWGTSALPQSPSSPWDLTVEMRNMLVW